MQCSEYQKFMNFQIALQTGHLVVDAILQTVSSQHCSKNYEFLVLMIVPAFNSAMWWFSEHKILNIYPIFPRS
jgi:hypothetical protein